MEYIIHILENLFLGSQNFVLWLVEALGLKHARIWRRSTGWRNRRGSQVQEQKQREKQWKRQCFSSWLNYEVAAVAAAAVKGTVYSQSWTSTAALWGEKKKITHALAMEMRGGRETDE